MYIRGLTKFGIKVLWRLQFLEYLRSEDLMFEISEGSDQNWTCPESALLAVWASSTPETVAFTIPWYQTWLNL